MPRVLRQQAPSHLKSARIPPACAVCLRADVHVRDDGTLSNHRDVSGSPCEGSRQRVMARGKGA